MLTGLNDFISQILSLFQWWIVVAPWESAIRVRRGRNITVLQPGIHFRIPSLDRFFVQRTRKRFINIPTQTVTTLDRQALTVSGGTAFSITDIGKLYNTLSDPEDVIQVETLGLVARFVAAHNMKDTHPENIQDYVNENIHLEQYGMGGVAFVVTDFVCVKTYRIIQGGPKDWSANAALSTDREKIVGQLPR